jgi:hypothetical protein
LARLANEILGGVPRSPLLLHALGCLLGRAFDHFLCNALSVSSASSGCQDGEAPTSASTGHSHSTLISRAQRHFCHPIRRHDELGDAALPLLSIAKVDTARAGTSDVGKRHFCASSDRQASGRGVVSQFEILSALGRRPDRRAPSSLRPHSAGNGQVGGMPSCAQFRLP